MTIEEAKAKLISWANTQVGYREGENNWNKYAENDDLRKLYGWKAQNQPWCDILYDVGMIDCFGLELASKLTYQPIGKGSAACRYSAGFYSAHEAFYQTPEVGDQVFFYVGDAINHTGIVVEVTTTLVYVVEGNSSDRVAKRSYYKGSLNIAGYGRPDWNVILSENNRDEKKDESEVIPEKPIVVITGLPSLKKGDGGKNSPLRESVRSAQILLNGRGFSVGKWGTDGEFGKDTRLAVLAFQKKNKLNEDGIIGNQTWAKLLGV